MFNGENIRVLCIFSFILTNNIILLLRDNVNNIMFLKELQHF